MSSFNVNLLPIENRVLVVEQADFSSALALRQTCRHFKGLVDTYSVARKAIEELSATLERWRSAPFQEVLIDRVLLRSCNRNDVNEIADSVLRAMYEDVKKIENVRKILRIFPELAIPWMTRELINNLELTFIEKFASRDILRANRQRVIQVAVEIALRIRPEIKEAMNHDPAFKSKFLEKWKSSKIVRDINTVETEDLHDGFSIRYFDVRTRSPKVMRSVKLPTYGHMLMDYWRQHLYEEAGRLV